MGCKEDSHTALFYVIEANFSQINLEWDQNLDLVPLPEYTLPVRLIFIPFSPNSDENEISLYIITTCSNIQEIRIKEVITKDKTSWYLDKFSLLVP